MNATTLPLRFVLTSEMYGEPTICCPICGQTYVHLGPVAVEQGHTLTLVSGENTVVKPTDRHKRERGSLVQLTFAGECGHVFTYSLNFYKGGVLIGLAGCESEQWPP